MMLIFLNYESLDKNHLIKWIKWLSVLFYITTFILLIIFSIYPKAYVFLIEYFYNEEKRMLLINLDTSRFSFHFTDPNSFGYMVVMLLAFLLSLPMRLNRKLIYIACSSVLVLATQSRGAILSLSLVISLFWFIYLPLKYKLPFFIVSAFIAVAYYFAFHDSINIALKGLEHRAEIEENMGVGLGGGRLHSWSYFLKNINLNPFFGVGYNLEVNGDIYRPHSDFIRLNLSYGLLIYFLLMYMFLDKVRGNLMLVASFLIPFFINTVIDDYRLFGLFIVFVFTSKSLSCQKRSTDIYFKKCNRT
jgi:hypothetical protein